MLRRILAVERSPLAKNVYTMILSGLTDVEMEAGTFESVEEFKVKAKKTDLIIMDHSTLAERKDEFYHAVKGAVFGTKTPCILIVRQGSIQEWENFLKIGRLELLERPFFPEDFLNTVKKLWGVN